MSQTSRHPFLLGLALGVTFAVTGCAGATDPEPAEVAVEMPESSDDADAPDNQGSPEQTAPSEEVDSATVDSGAGEDAEEPDHGADSATPVFHVAEDPPPARSELASGIVVGRELQPEASTSWYVVLSLGSDGSIEENWRFKVARATANEDPAYATAALAPDAFSADLTKVAGTARYRLDPIGFDTHVGYFDIEGNFTSLAGREEPEPRVSQSDPVFGPDDRLWYWQQAPGAQQELWSVAVDGSDRRQEEPGLTVPGQAFTFTQGAHRVPVYVQHRDAAIADDASLAVRHDHNGWRFGPAGGADDLATLAQGPQLSPTDEALAPWAFLPGSSQDLLCGTSAVRICQVDVDGGHYGVSDELSPDEERWQGAPYSPRLLADGSVAWTTRNSWTEEGTHVARVVRMNPEDGVVLTTGALAHDNPNAPFPQVLGLMP